MAFLSSLCLQDFIPGESYPEKQRFFLQVRCSLDSSTVLTSADAGNHILTFGDNSLGQLGRDSLNHQGGKDANLWVLHGTDGEPLCATSITAGLSQSMAVLCSGQVQLSTADLWRKELSASSQQRQRFQCTWKVMQGVGVVQVAVWGWQHGLEGLPETPVRPEPIPGLAVPANDEHALSKSISERVHIAAGRVHSLIAAPSEALSFWDAAEGPFSTQWSLQDEGWRGDALLSWGNGQNGRLGLGSSESIGEPEVVAELEGYQILDMACGHDHSLVLAAKA